MGAILHWESCRQNILRFVSMSVITNYFCQIYENVDIMFIEIYKKNLYAPRAVHFNELNGQPLHINEI
jgi:hypothetical protein